MRRTRLVPPRRAAAAPVLMAVSVLLLAAPAFAQTPPPLLLSVVAADPAGETVTITGANFGPRPLVTLDLLPVNVRFSNASQIVAAVPVARMPPGKYLFTVSRGPGAGDSASSPLVIAGTPAAAAAPVAAGAIPSATDVAVTVGADAVSIAEVDAAWARDDPATYLMAARLLYEHRRRTADRLAADRLLEAEARRRNLTVDALLAEELPRRRIAMPDSAVTSIYRGLGERARGASLEQMQPAIRAWLAEQTEPVLARMAYLEELGKVATRVDLRLLPPKIEVAVLPADAALGAASAPIQLLAFGDFESEGYAAMAAAFPRIRETFGDRLRIVFRQLPVLGPESVAIAEASACAHRQGRFWNYHDLVVTQPGPFGAARLAAIAGEAGLDRPAFDRCVAGGETRDSVRQALDEAARYGVSESPSVIVNGRLAPPPPPFLPPFEFLKRLIEEELQRQATAR